jgi:predicted alpha-1,2-mannosidase
MKRSLSPILLALLVISSACPIHAQGTPAFSPVDFVNPYIGGISQELVSTVPVMQLPNSMMRVGVNRGDFTSPILAGLPLFQATHYDGAAMTICPVNGEARASNPVPSCHYDQEHGTPYRYSVHLEDDNIDVAFAPSYRAAIYRFSFDEAAHPYLAVSAHDGELSVSGNTISGYRNYGGGKIYIYMLLSAAPVQFGEIVGGAIHYGKPTAGNPDLALAFAPGLHTLSARYGISYISVAQAKRSLGEEIDNFDLDKVASAGRAAWNAALGKITVYGGSYDQKVVFYTALWHTYERMVNVSEDGSYWSGFDKKAHNDNGIPYYTDDATWDSFRALHALAALLDPKRESDEDNSYVRSAMQSGTGWVPTTPEISGDGHVMNGNHFAVIMWDDYAKGVPGIDLANGYKALKNTMSQETMLPWQKEQAGTLDQFYYAHGYFPALKPGEAETVQGVHPFERRQAVPVTLGASYDAWSMAQIAKALGKTDDYTTFLGHAFNYRHLYNPATGFFHAKDASGSFIEPMDYIFSGSFGDRDYYDENNGWTYRWDLPYNVGDLVQMMGGPAQFAHNLDQTFETGLGRSKRDYFEQLPDATGYIGQFAIGNEPGMHIPYLYNYAGEPWKTQKAVRQVLETWWRNDLQGIPGDEDGGGLSAFAVFSSIGFYPVSPGLPVYNIGSPLFSKVVVSLTNGKTFVVVANGCSHDSKYVQSATFNGKPWNKPWFTQQQATDEGRLVLQMGAVPNKQWGSSPDDAPPSTATPANAPAPGS